MKATLIFIASMMPVALMAADRPTDEEPIQVQTEIRPPQQKLTQGTLEAKVRDNLFKKEEKEEKEAAKKE